MSTDVSLVQPNRLTASRLPKWAVPATLVGTIAVMLLVFWATPWQGRADFVVATAIAFIIVMTAVSWIFEDGRRARNRLAGNLLLSTMVLAILPLVVVLGYTIAKGLKRFDSVFLTHSMRNVAESDPGWRCLPRDHRHHRAGRHRDADRSPHRLDGFDLSGRVRRGQPLRPTRVDLRRRDDRAALDRRRPVHPVVLDHRSWGTASPASPARWR